MPTIIDQKDELVRSLGRLGVGLIDLVTSLSDELVVLDRGRRVIVVAGELFDEHPPASLRSAHRRALHNESTTYEWVKGKGRDTVRLSTTAFPLRNARATVVAVVLMTRKVASLGRRAEDRGMMPGTATQRLFELEQGIQQLTATIQNYRRAGELPPGIDATSPLHQLSVRERQVLTLLGQGYRPRSIAENLHVSPDTVRNHLKAMFKKTHTHSQEELTALLRAAHGL